MADDGLVIRGIDWRQTFPFVQIFRSFRIAIHLSKLAMGMALLLTIFFGGSILDSLWPARSRAVDGEIAQYQLIVSGAEQGTLTDWRISMQKQTEDAYAAMLLQYGVIPPSTNPLSDTSHQTAETAAAGHHDLSDLTKKIIAHRDEQVMTIDKEYSDALAAADKTYNAKPDAPDAAKIQKEAKDAAKQQWTNDRRAAYDAASADIRKAQSIMGVGLFDTFFNFEIRQVTNVVYSVVRNNWVDSGGVVDSIYNFFAIGPTWLIWNHTVFFILFALLFLLAWSLFGGAISRMAAVHIARDEKISVREALNFAVGKLLSFASAPVIPVVIVLVIGLVVSVVAMVFGCSSLLSPIMGIFFFLPLLAGFVMTLVLLGTVGGINLMYPTIAVEGSDSFDAISRSFSYVYARPWRLLFYTAVAIVYGAATYLFVHVFIWLMLVVVHNFAGLWMFRSAPNTRDLFSTMWPSPLVTGRLAYSYDYTALGYGDRIAAFCIQGWVMLLVAFLGAFAISLYFSSNTIIYFLIRSEVDATEMEDVYLEQPEEDDEPIVAVATTTTVAVATEPAPPAAEAPRTEPPPSGDAPTA